MARGTWSDPRQDRPDHRRARGIGAETARRLAARGARLSLVGLEPELLEQVASECGDAAWFEADVTDRDALAGRCRRDVERFGGIDVVMANAGIGAGGTVRDDGPARRGSVSSRSTCSASTAPPRLPPARDRAARVRAAGGVDRGRHPHARHVRVRGDRRRASRRSATRCAARSPIGRRRRRRLLLVDRHRDGARRGREPGHEVHALEAARPGRQDLPVSRQAGAVAEAGIEPRAADHRAAPVPRAALARMLVARLTEQQARRDVAEFVRLMEEEAEKRGAEASQPVGAGGAADDRARTRNAAGRTRARSLTPRGAAHAGPAAFPQKRTAPGGRSGAARGRSDAFGREKSSGARGAVAGEPLSVQLGGAGGQQEGQRGRLAGEAEDDGGADQHERDRGVVRRVGGDRERAAALGRAVAETASRRARRR